MDLCTEPRTEKCLCVCVCVCVCVHVRVRVRVFITILPNVGKMENGLTVHGQVCEQN